MSSYSALLDQRTAPTAPTGPVPVIYILGAGHSGSTLLAMLLGTHPRICTVGEVKAPAVGEVATYRCSCGKILAACAFWRALADEVEALGSRLDFASGTTDIRKAQNAYVRALLKPLHRPPALEAVRELALALSPAWRVHLAKVQALTAALARAACTVTVKDVFIDSSKTGVQLKYLLRNPALDVKVIRLVRDGRGVSLSYRKANGLSMADAAFEWRRSNEEAETIVSRLNPTRWFDLRYERLCRDVEGTMRQLFTFIGVEPPRSLAHVAASDQHVLGNNRMRLNAGEVRLDEQWRHILTGDDLREFDRVAGVVNRRLGYE